jgi:hypothetical protein
VQIDLCLLQKTSNASHIKIISQITVADLSLKTVQWSRVAEKPCFSSGRRKPDCIYTAGTVDATSRALRNSDMWRCGWRCKRGPVVRIQPSIHLIQKLGRCLKQTTTIGSLTYAHKFMSYQISTDLGPKIWAVNCRTNQRGVYQPQCINRARNFW